MGPTPPVGGGDRDTGEVCCAKPSERQMLALYLRLQGSEPGYARGTCPSARAHALTLTHSLVRTLVRSSSRSSARTRARARPLPKYLPGFRYDVRVVAC